MSTLWIGTVALLVVAIGILVIPLRRLNWSAPMLLAVALVPVVAVSLYLTLGASQQLRDPNLTERPPETPPASIAEMVGGLAARLQENPQDPEGWRMLGRSYVVLGEYQQALTAYETAWQQTTNPDLDLKLELAEALFLVDQTSLTGQAGQLIEEVLAGAPQDPRALLFGGLVAQAKQAPALARERFVALLALNPPAPIAKIVNERLAALGGAPVDDKPAAAEATGFSIAISVAPDIQPSAITNAKALFLIARNPNGGPPIAVVRHAPTELPGVFTLSDANAMLPGNRLTDFPELTVIARLSQTGQPLAQPGDHYGELPVKTDESRRLTITIDRQIPLPIGQ